MNLGDLFKSLRDKGRVDIAKRYEVLRAAVSGTMSNFHMARDRESDRIVGLKILDKDKTTALDKRFKGLKRPSEGEIATAMDHPRIVRTESFGMTTNGELYLVMEFLDGPGLNSLIIARSELLDGNRLTLMRQAAEAIDYVHKQGYIHRDVCPRNFVCSKDASSLKLIDFGLTVPATPDFMQPGIRTGTPNYMAPEVVRRRPTDQRLDVFSFGVSMYEMYAFDLPWPRGADGMAAMAHGASEPPPLRSLCPGVDPAVEEAIHKCLHDKPEQRWPSMEALLKHIKRAAPEKKP